MHVIQVVQLFSRGKSVHRWITLKTDSVEYHKQRQLDIRKATTAYSSASGCFLVSTTKNRTKWFGTDFMYMPESDVPLPYRDMHRSYIKTLQESNDETIHRI